MKQIKPLTNTIGYALITIPYMVKKTAPIRFSNLSFTIPFMVKETATNTDAM